MIPPTLVTKAKLIERRKIEKKFADLLEAAPDAIVIMDRSGDIVLINARTATLFGYARADLLGQKSSLCHRRATAPGVGHAGIGFLPRRRPAQ